MASLLPVDDTWAAEGFAGAGLRGYLRCRPWGAGPGDLAIYELVALLSRHHKGYPQGAAMATDGASSDPDGHSWMLWRRPVQANSAVRFAWGASMFSGVADNDSFRMAGVCSRVAVGSPSGTVLLQHFDNVSGYFWVYVYEFGRTWRHVLFRLNAGTFTLLDTVGEANAFSQSPGSGGSWLPAPRTWRFLVENESGDVRLRGYQINHGLGGGEQLVFDVTDTSGSKITAGGLPGFALQTPRVQSGGQRPLATSSFFGVSAPGSGLIFVDQWQREFEGTGIEQTDLYSTSAQDLSHLWLGDQCGYSTIGNGGPFVHLLERETGSPSNAARLGGPVVLHSANQTWGFHLSQRIADDPVKQHRRLLCQFATTDTSEDREIGIFLRGTISDPLPQYADTTTGREGYLATLHYAGGTGAFTARLYQYRAGNRQTVATASLTAHALTLGTVASISVEGLNQAASSIIGSGLPSFAMKINGVDVTTWVAQAGNVVITDARWVTDQRINATKQGSIEGWYFKGSKAVSSPLAWALGWEQLPFSSDPILPPQAQQSIALPSETAGKTGTLVIPLTWSVRLAHGSTVHEHKGESLHRQRIPHSTRSRRRWAVQSSGLSDSDRAALVAFFDAHRGSEIPFDWVPRTGTTPDGVHFLSWNLAASPYAPGKSEVEFVLEELFDGV